MPPGELHSLDRDTIVEVAERVLRFGGVRGGVAVGRQLAQLGELVEECLDELAVLGGELAECGCQELLLA